MPSQIPPWKGNPPEPSRIPSILASFRQLIDRCAEQSELHYALLEWISDMEEQLKRITELQKSANEQPSLTEEQKRAIEQRVEFSTMDIEKHIETSPEIKDGVIIVCRNGLFAVDDNHEWLMQIFDCEPSPDYITSIYVHFFFGGKVVGRLRREILAGNRLGPDDECLLMCAIYFRDYVQQTRKNLNIRLEQTEISDTSVGDVHE